jgi:hypothetical protein
MIPANELRIGNAYAIGFLSSRNDISPVVEIIKNEDDLQYAAMVGQSIPLTPEILEQCGFKTLVIDCGAYIVYSNEFMMLDSNFEIVLCDGLIDEINAQFPNPLKYLHQLQNVNFALKNVELELKNSY